MDNLLVKRIYEVDSLYAEDICRFHFLPPVCDFVTRFTPSKFVYHVLPCTCNDVSSFTLFNHLYHFLTYRTH